MKKYFGKPISVFVIVFNTSCNTSSKTLKENIQNTSGRAAKEEPSNPEETEIWKPIPPTVNPFGQNGVPSDAIVLFDGYNFDEWISAKDSTEVQWVLNGGGSMTVKDKTGDI
jgi:hypothetical protein